MEYGGDAQQPTVVETEQQPDPAEPADPDAPPPSYEETSKEPSLSGAGDGGFWAQRRPRIVSLNAILLWFYLLSLWRWTDVENSDQSLDEDKVEAAYGFYAAGGFFTVFGVIGTLVIQALEYRETIERLRIVDIVCSGVLIFGAALYIIGGIALADYINSEFDSVDEHESLAGIAFFEASLVGAVTIALAVDITTDWLSISQRIRIYFVFVPILLFCSLLLFFCYAIYADSLDDDDDTKPSLGCVAAGWFFVLCATSVYLFTEFAEICCSFNAGLSAGCLQFQSMILHGCNVVLFFGTFLVFAGMCDTGSQISGSAGDNNPYAGESDDNINAFYVGYAFFAWLFGIWITLDVSWGEIIMARFG